MNDSTERMWLIYQATREQSAYGLWTLVAANALVFIVFALSFGRPRTMLEWRSFGGFSAFVVALFTEMYGVPLTLYALSGWLQSTYPQLDLLTHDAGLLLQWPTVLTLAMFPVLVWMYARLARLEEGEMQARFGEAYQRSVSGIRRFMPRFRRPGRPKRRSAVEHAR